MKLPEFYFVVGKNSTKGIQYNSLFKASEVFLQHVLVWAGNRDRAGGSGGVGESAVLGGAALPD